MSFTIGRRCLFGQAALLFLLQSATLLDIMSQVCVVVVGVGDDTIVGRGAYRVSNMVVRRVALLRVGTVVQVLVVVLMRNIEGWIRVASNAWHGRAVVFTRYVGHGSGLARFPRLN